MMNNIQAVIAASFVFFVQASAFLHTRTLMRTSAYDLMMNPPEGPAGSFFHQVPDESDNGEDPEKEAQNIDDQVAELLRQRRKPPKASKPSTINGLPTQEATGKSHMEQALNSIPFLVS